MKDTKTVEDILSEQIPMTDISLKQKFINTRNEFNKYGRGVILGLGICKDFNPAERLQIATKFDEIIAIFDEHIKKYVRLNGREVITPSPISILFLKV